MTELCDYINHWERKKIDWDKSLINNGHLLIDNTLDLSDKNIMKKIKITFDEFDIELREYIDEEKDVEILLDNYRNKLNKIGIGEELIANYVIKTAYRSVSSDKVLCWMLYGDTLLSNLRVNSDERKECEIVQTDKDDIDGREFLGKYFKLTTKE